MQSAVGAHTDAGHRGQWAEQQQGAEPRRLLPFLAHLRDDVSPPERVSAALLAIATQRSDSVFKRSLKGHLWNKELLSVWRGSLYFIICCLSDAAGNVTPDNTVVLRPVSPERTDAPLPVALKELDPETLRSGLRDFLQELREAQRERVTHCTISHHDNYTYSIHTSGQECSVYSKFCRLKTLLELK